MKEEKTLARYDYRLDLDYHFASSQAPEFLQQSLRDCEQMLWASPASDFRECAEEALRINAPEGPAGNEMLNDACEFLAAEGFVERVVIDEFLDYPQHLFDEVTLSEVLFKAALLAIEECLSRHDFEIVENAFLKTLNTANACDISAFIQDRINFYGDEISIEALLRDFRKLAA